jgi:hypothetical protein
MLKARPKFLDHNRLPKVSVKISKEMAAGFALLLAFAALAAGEKAGEGCPEVGCTGNRPVLALVYPSQGKGGAGVAAGPKVPCPPSREVRHFYYFHACAVSTRSGRVSFRNCRHRFDLVIARPNPVVSGSVDQLTVSKINPASEKLNDDAKPDTSVVEDLTGSDADDRPKEREATIVPRKVSS